jgi:hypothetical protein
MNISFNKREVKCVPSLPHVIESGFIPNRAVEVRQLAKGKGYHVLILMQKIKQI